MLWRAQGLSYAGSAASPGRRLLLRPALLLRAALPLRRAPGPDAPARRAAPLLLAGLLCALPAGAQDLEDLSAPVALVADRIAFDEAAGVLTASGAVEVYQGARTLQAEEIVYDARAERLTVRGPLVLADPSGVTVVADAAALDADLREGVIEGARAFIDQGAATVAAVEARRAEGRYTAFSKAVYSSCAVCAASPTPLWSIRARRVIHDDVENVIWYEDAVFEILGTPVAWLPIARMPDPTVERLSGFLAPEFSRSGRYGVGVRLPYFITLGPTRDVTLTPFVTTGDGPILEGEYRQRLDAGAFELAGSLGYVDIGGDEETEFRGHLFGDGVFDAAPLGFGRDAQAGFEIELASDDGYLRRYDYTDRDRLESVLFARRFGEESFYEVEAIRFQSLREGEPQDEIPLVLPQFSLREALLDSSALGELALEASSYGLVRRDGRDVGRLTAALDWERREILPGGFVLTGFAQARGDLYAINDAFEDRDDRVVGRFAPFAGAELGFPLLSVRESGSHLLEPIAQFVLAPEDLNDDDIPNEDSLVVEFDEQNLFEVNRFPGYDRVESGPRANLGFRYGFVGVGGLTVDAAAGRVLRLAEEEAFEPGAGLSELDSDWVAGWSVRLDGAFALAHRIRVSDAFDVARNEAFGEIDLGRARLNASYAFLEEDAQLGAEEDRSEAAFGAEVDVTRSVSLAGYVRRDLGEDEFVEVEGAIAYRNECAALEVFAGRDFTRSEDAPPSTTVGLRVRLFGAADGARRGSGVCAAPMTTPPISYE